MFYVYIHIKEKMYLCFKHYEQINRKNKNLGQKFKILRILKFTSGIAKTYNFCQMLMWIFLRNTAVFSNDCFSN